MHQWARKLYRREPSSWQGQISREVPGKDRHTVPPGWSRHLTLQKLSCFETPATGSPEAVLVVVLVVVVVVVVVEKEDGANPTCSTLVHWALYPG